MCKRQQVFSARPFALGIIAFVGLVCGTAFSRQLATADFEVLETFGTNNISAEGSFAFAAAGNQGLIVVNTTTVSVVDAFAPTANTSSIDDVSVDGDLLFALDGSGPGGAISAFSIANPLEPTLVAGPTAVDVGPFAGVSAANGRVVVSGGTGLLSVLSYQEDGSLNPSVGSIDLGIGQPDVLIADDGQTAFVSTDFSGFVDGQTFGITVIDISNAPQSISILDQVGVAGAGFTPGFDTPANFPAESALQGDTLFFASGSGVTVFDVSNPSSLATITTIPLTTNPVNVDVLDDELFVVGNSPTPTLSVIDISDLSSPVVETTALPGGGRPLSVAVTSDSVVIADEELGVLIENLLLPGDFDGDDDVDGADFLAWQRGESPSPLSEGDLTDFLNNFGVSSPTMPFAVAVPEPTTTYLVLTGLLSSLAVCRKSQKFTV